MNLARVTALALVLLVPAGLAQADAIEGPPACPPGARGRSAHEGQWCVPASCDAGCDAGQECRDYRVCTQTAMVIPGGLRPREPDPEPRELVVGTCDPSAACDGTEEPPPPYVGTLPTSAPTCSTQRVCVPAALPSMPTSLEAPPPSASSASPPSAAAPEPPRSCLCSAPGASRPTSLAWLALAALALLRSRR